MIRVCVIGAGAAGLCMARHLTSRKDLFVTSVFEQSGKIGGTWVYTDSVGTDEYGLPIHSSMYKNLRTNRPKEVMAFQDFPFSAHLNSFLHHTSVQKYLEDYGNHFKLMEYINLYSQVTLVKPVKDSDPSKTQWIVSVKNLKTCKEEDHLFDAVVVCNGHFSVPYIPKISGLDSFPGFVVHSHGYREPEEYKDKSVVILGAGASGKDISLEIAEYARMVYLSHNNPTVVCKMPDNLEEVQGIEEFDSHGNVYFMDGTKSHVDGILFCTGYKYSFPFLTKDCGINVEDFRVKNLYKHVFNTKFPSMSFVGIPFHIIPFKQFHLQALLILSVLSGQKSLPSQNEMERNVDDDFNWRVNELGFKPKWAHRLGKLQWEYNDQLAELVDCEKLDPLCIKLYDLVDDLRINQLMFYKNMNFELKDDKTWGIIPRK